MNEVLHANIFFVIASIATIAFAVLVCIAMIYVIKILASIRAIVQRIEDGSDIIAEDISAMREFVAGGGFISYIVGLISPARRSRRQTKSRKNTNPSDSD